MNNLILFSVVNISATFIISIILIKRKHFVRALKIFLCLYTIGQIVGYGLNVDILKAVVPSFSDPETGVAFQVITSTGFPLLLAFIIDYIYKLLKK